MTLRSMGELLPAHLNRNVLTEILNSLYDGVYCINKNHQIIFWNNTAHTLTGFSAAEVLGRSCADDLLRHVDASGASLCETICPLHKTIEDGEPREALVYLHHKAGHRVPVIIRTSPLRDETGEILGGIELFSEAQVLKKLMSENRKEIERGLVDCLTGLPNRRLIEQKIAEADLQLQRYGQHFTLLALDIDHLKSYNEVYGHETGDLLLQMVGRTLTGWTQNKDFFARWGDDEFLGILSQPHDQDIQTIIENLRGLVESAFIEINGESLSVTISAGFCPTQDAGTMEDALAAAFNNLRRRKQRDCPAGSS